MTQSSTRYADDLPGADLPLSAEHRRELIRDSAIHPDVIRERGYTTMERPDNGSVDAFGRDSHQQLKALGFPSWAIRERYFYPGLWLPQYSPAGLRYAGQFKPKNAVPGRDGKPQRYASAKGPSRLDVHPRWSRDRGGMQLPAIQDPTERLWITEGVKKADALTSRGEITIALAGVYNWRTAHATLGDWEDVRLKDREVVICFDADAITKPHVAQAMARLGKWLRHKGARKIWYLVVPGMVNGKAVKGVDDWFAAGGTVKGLERAFDTRPPDVTDTQDRFTDARLAETLANEVLDGRYIWVTGMDWLRFDGVRWQDVHEVNVLEAVRQWTLDRFQEAVARLKLDDKSAGAEVDGWRTMLGANRAAIVLKAARGIVHHESDELDADPAHLNTPSGYLDLEQATLQPVGETEYPTKVTGGRYDPNAVSPLWETFLARVQPDPEVRAFLQRLFGYALLGEVREHIMPIFTGDGANGKGTMRDALLAAFGDYAVEVDPEILMVQHNPRHGTFLMELRGRRLVFSSETEEGRRFAEQTMRRLTGGDPIQGNRMRRDPITFRPSHTFCLCTNHLPRLSDHDANWRRVLVVPFDVVIPEDERDGTLPRRLQEPEVRAAVLAWCYAGFQEYLRVGLNPPGAVRMRTKAYRGESDLIGRFLTERVEASTAGRVPAKALYDAYLAWHRVEASRDEAPLAASVLGKELAKRGWASTRSNGITIFRGMALTDPDGAETL